MTQNIESSVSQGVVTGVVNGGPNGDANGDVKVMKRRSLIRVAGACAAAVALPRYAFAQTAYKAEYKMSTVVPPAFAWGKGGEIFANLVRERTGGRINIKQYPGASLVQGDQTRELSAMRQGIIDVLCGAPVNWTGTARGLGVFTLPFLFPDHKAWDAVMASDVVQKDYFDLVRNAGAEPLAVGETGYRQISNNKRPIFKPDDLKGIKIRVVGSPMYGEIMSCMGANPTFMGWADAQPALASGAVDGQENPLEVFLAAKVSYIGTEICHQVELLQRRFTVCHCRAGLAKLDPRRPENRPRGGRGGRHPAGGAGTYPICAGCGTRQGAWRAGACAHGRRNAGVANRNAPNLCPLEGANRCCTSGQG